MTTPVGGSSHTGDSAPFDGPGRARSSAHADDPSRSGGEARARAGTAVATGTRRAWAVVVGRVLLVGFILVQLYAVYWPREPAATTFRMEDKLAHALVFAAPVAVSVAFRLRPRFVVPLIALNAPVSELVQWRFLAGRDGDVWDVTADLVGVALGVLAGFLLRRRLGPVGSSSTP
ncbi:conserved hypothetical protein [Nostocoides japonicum T1-X7]|uniref:VanZ-like domain-containing protein n=1 Tax=Nostocoides japonicum T1-X7 TaxID=1194083 RepID=A0A077LVT5_9MICO|nr:VanZ family protein [Tetrasphaera japonica]CCH77801.1 conserved hypothetical protein [Tetrasphaera japonica T1-X7]